MTTHLHRATQSNKKWGGEFKEKLKWAQLHRTNIKILNEFHFKVDRLFCIFLFQMICHGIPQIEVNVEPECRETFTISYFILKKPKNNKKWLVLFEAASPIPNWKKKWSPSPHHHDQNETSTTTTIYYITTRLFSLSFFSSSFLLRTNLI